MAEIHIDTRDLGRLARTLKKADVEVGKQFPKALKAAGDIVASEAKTIAGGFSSRIPGTVRVVGGARRVAVRAGGARAPHAAAFEHQGQSGTFRHPVFGNQDVWVQQQAHPFLQPAADRKTEAFMAAVTHVVDDALKQVGF